MIIICFALILISGCSDKYNPDEYTLITQNASFPTEQWSKALPEELGIDSYILDKADKLIKRKYPNFKSMLVIRKGYLVYEKFYNNFYPKQLNSVYSVTKSVMSALTGIAIEQGLISSIKDKVSDYIPQYFMDIDDARKNDITIENVLTMMGGLSSIDENYTTYFLAQDWVEAALKMPMNNAPGEAFEYNTGLTQLLSAVIEETSDMSVLEYANEYLFSKIGMNVNRWDHDEFGSHGGGFGLYLTSYDMARFGYLYMNKGNWDGQQIIPEQWVLDSTAKKIQISETQDYGYLFTLEQITDTVNDKTYSMYQAYGSGGQIIMVIPELDLLIVISCNASISPTVKPMTRDIITDYILPSVYVIE